MSKKKKKYRTNSYEFIDSLMLNENTYIDYIERIKKICLSMFVWENLPKSMNSRYLEECLFYLGQASLLYDEDYGFINTKVTSNGEINIYGLPTRLNCYSYRYQTYRNLYIGLSDSPEKQTTEEAILVMNNYERIPTLVTTELFAYRLYEADMTAMTNIKAQKTPVLILCKESQRLTLENMYSQYEGNRPVIFGDQDSLDINSIKSVNTNAPFIADKIMEYKKEIWNELLSFLGINNLATEKKERLITDEASSNNELINMNLQSFLIPRQEACKKFNELFGLTGTDKEISVRVRSDLYNIIKKELSITKDFDSEIENKEVEVNG